VDVVECANREGVFPRFTFFHLPGLDAVSHRHGPFSREARSFLKNIDRAMGELMEGLERNGALERVCVVWVADHGQIFLGKENYLLLEKFFAEELGIPALDRYNSVDRSDCSKKREAYYARFAVIAANNGRNASLYVRHNPEGQWVSPNRMAPWTQKPSWKELRNYPTPRGTVDLVEKLRCAQGVRFVIGQPRAGEVALYSARGDGVIRTAIIGGETRYAYAVAEGDDPLGYRAAPDAAKLMDNGYHSSHEWLRATCSLGQPDIVAQLPSLFESRFAGDLFLVAADEWDFEEVNASSHGGFLRGEMLVPLVLAGPRIRKGTFGPVRVVDVMPTVLEYLGCGDRIKGLDLDGVSFWEEIDNTNPKSQLKSLL
jgi:arylsulfatase A-like enzyme